MSFTSIDSPTAKPSKGLKNSAESVLNRLSRKFIT